MNQACLDFVGKWLPRSPGRVLEVGSYGESAKLVRALVLELGGTYVGIDARPGPNVDVPVPAEGFHGSFDVVLAIEVAEHTLDWQAFVHALKTLTTENGIILLTTRSPGYPYHAEPVDHWRFTLEHAGDAFADCDLLAVEEDKSAPGVFVAARKPASFQERPPTLAPLRAPEAPL